MKHIKTPVPAEVYYYIQWRSNCFRFILAIAILTNCVVWFVVAALYGSANGCIWSAVAAVFFGFVTLIKLRDCERSHDRYLRAACNPSLINSDHVNQ